MLDDARPIPRLTIGVDLARLAELAAALPTLLAAGIDGAVVQAADAGDDSVPMDELARLRAALGGEAILLHGPISLARRAGVGVLLPERGVATAEARRLLGANLPVARLVGSAAAATAARGADLLVIERAVAGDLAIVRRVAAAGWEPALVWCAPEPDAARARFAAGCEGIVVAWEDVDPRSPADALKRLAAALPPKPSGAGALVPIVFDGASLAVEPDTTIADLLADAGLPDNVVVRVNGVRLARHRYDETATRPGDAIEVDRTSAGRRRDSD